MLNTSNNKSAELLGGAALALLSGIGITLIAKQGCRYDCEGYDKDGFDKNGYDRDGYDALGFDRYGMDADGYDADGYDIQGYDRSGRNAQGFNRAGYDAEGYDRKGYDAEGYRRDGFNSKGFNRLGLDWDGYDCDSYNPSGTDRAGHCRQYYKDHVAMLRSRIGAAYRQMQGYEYRYAIFDARVVMDETLRMLVQHTCGEDATGDKMLVNLKICEQKQLLGEDSTFIDRLHSVRRICNCNGHELEAEAGMTHNKVYFVIMQIRDLLDVAEKIIA